MRASILCLVFLPAIAICAPRPSLAAWSPSTNTVCAAAADQTLVTAVADGAGGVFMAWVDMRNGSQDVYAQHVAAGGHVQWTSSGVPVCTASGDQRKAVIEPDGAGGAFFVWMDSRSGNFDVYAQRLNADGQPVWTANGVTVASGSGNQDDPDMVPDAAGGVLVAWEDARSGTDDIYAQRVNGAGIPQWTANGVALCTASSAQGDPTCVSDGSGGMLVAWQDSRGGSGTDDVYARRINGSGVPQWAANGVPVCTAANKQNDPVLVSDGAGGGIAVWEDNRNGSDDNIYAQRLTLAGTVSWTANGVAVCTAADDQVVPAIVPDGSGGAIIAWEDPRTGTADVYAQRLNSSGAILWTSNGVAVCTASGVQGAPAVVAGEAGGATVAWQDARGGVDDIYVQRLDGSGSVQLTANGDVVTSAAGAQQFVQAVSDGWGGAILGWQDARSGSHFDIHAQRIGSRGTADVPVPAGRLAWLKGPVPQPLHTGCEMSFAVAERQRVVLTVHDVQGRLVNTLVDRVLEAGEHHASWDRTDARGRKVPMGLYVFRLDAGGVRRSARGVAVR